MSNLNAFGLTSDKTQSGLVRLSDPLKRVVREAVKLGATDIHFDPVGENKEVRARVHGIIRHLETLEGDQRLKLLNQVKVACDFKIDRSFTPLEGQVRFEENGRTYEMRVSVVPTGRREAIHLRFISEEMFQKDAADLGMEKDDLADVRQTLKFLRGLVLVSGTTGSGKSTTCYSLLNTLDLRKNVTVSIEDPIEARLSFMRQIQVDDARGLSMVNGLRALLRMDPDVIYIGEIRDPQSALIAARAALAGRLVLATIHAPNAHMAIAALENMDVPRYVIAGALRMIVNQELVPVICAACAKSKAPCTDHKKMFRQAGMSVPKRVFYPEDCLTCDSFGYVGRTGVFEVTRVSAKASRAILEGVKNAELEEIFAESRRKSMLCNALAKAATGQISMEAVELIAADKNFNI